MRLIWVYFENSEEDSDSECEGDSKSESGDEPEVYMYTVKELVTARGTDTERGWLGGLRRRRRDLGAG